MYFLASIIARIYSDIRSFPYRDKAAEARR